MRALLRLLAVFVLLVAVAAAIPASRRGVLTGAGRALAASDAPEAVDLAAVDVDSGLAGAIAVADLYKSRAAPAVGTFVPRKSAIDQARRDRRVVAPDVVGDVLEQLGVPRHAIVRFPVDETDTAGTTAALAGWARANPTGRLLVVVAPSHGRRYRRVLGRVWPPGRPVPRVVAAEHSLFRADDWWQSRTTLREGLIELEKLALDYALHPWS